MKFVVTPGGEDWNIRFLQVRITAGLDQGLTPVSADISNIRLVDNRGTVIGSSIAVPSGNWGTVGTFSNSYRADFGLPMGNLGYFLPANQPRVISVKADIKSQAVIKEISGNLIAAPYANVATVSGSGTVSSGEILGNRLPVISAPVAAGPQVTVSSDTTGISNSLVMGSENNIVYKIRLSTDSDVKISSLKFTDTITNNDAGKVSLYNIGLYDPNTGVLLAGPVTMGLTADSPGKISFSQIADGFGNPIIISRGASKTFVVRANVLTPTSTIAKSGSVHTFGIASTADVVASDSSSGVLAVITGTPSGVAQTVVDGSSTASTSKATVALPLAQTVIYHDRVVMDFIGTKDIPAFEWGATGDGVSIKTVKLDFSGRAIMPPVTSTTSPVSAFSVDLMIKSFASSTFPDATWGSVTGLSNQKICNAGIAGSCSVTFSLDSALIPNGVKTKKVWIRVDSSLFTNNSNAQDSLSVQIKNAGDITWSDGSPSSMTWNPIEMPMTVANIYYP